MKFNGKETQQLTLHTDFDFDIVELNDGFCACCMEVNKQYINDLGLRVKNESDVREGVTETRMILGGSSEAEFNDALAWHRNSAPELYVVDEQFFEDLITYGTSSARRGLRDRVPQRNNFDFIQGYEGMLTVVY